MTEERFNREQADALYAKPEPPAAPKKGDVASFLDAMFTEPEEGDHLVFALSPPEGAPKPGRAVSKQAFIAKYRANPRQRAYVGTATCSQVRNKKENFTGLHFIVIDDIGTKAKQRDLPGNLQYPTSIVQTSEGNFQYGYKLDPVIRDLTEATAFVKAVYGAGPWDSGGGQATKLVRLPCGVHGDDDFKVRLDELHPYRVFNPGEMLATLGVDTLEEETRFNGSEAYAGQEYPEDDLLQRMAEEGWVVSDTGDEWVQIHCPWSEAHSDPQDTIAGYRPRGRGTDEWRGQRGFHCHHDHCSERDTQQFLELMNQQLNTEVPTKAAVMPDTPEVGPIEAHAKGEPAPVISATLAPRTGFHPGKCVLKSRPRLYGDYLLLGYLSMVNAPGGVGKSILLLVMAVSMAIGRDLLGLADLHKARKVLVLNNEDDYGEMELRLSAICKQCNLTEHELDLFAKNFDYQSGYARKLRLVVKGKDELKPTALQKELIDYCKEHDIEATFLDPLVSLHDAGENDNPAMDEVIAVLRTVAARGRTGLFLAHHSRKGAEADTPDDNARGATAITAGVRVNVGLSKMTKQEAKNFILPEDAWMDFIRLDNGKRNYAPNARNATWFQFKNTPLDCVDWESDEDVTEWVGVPRPGELQATEKQTEAWTLEKVMGRVLMGQIKSGFVKTGPTGEKLKKLLSSDKDPIGKSVLHERLSCFPAPSDGDTQVVAHEVRYRVWTTKNKQESNRMEYHYEAI